MPFLNELKVSIQGNNATLLDDFLYELPNKDNVIVRVHKGFETDWASIPLIFRPLVLGDRIRKSATVHDYLYRAKIGSRKFADKVFLGALKEEGASWWKRHLIYRAVRAFGWLARR